MEKDLEIIKKQRIVTAQKTFEKYMMKLVPTTKYKLCFYGSYNNLFVFSNGISIYSLNYQLVPNFITSMRGLALWDYRTEKLDSTELQTYLEKAQNLSGNNCEKPTEIKRETIFNTKITSLSTSEYSQKFNSLEFTYLNTFLGKKLKLFISPDFPILYGESEKGTAYVFGYKK